jgi:hypothetical protein
MPSNESINRTVFVGALHGMMTAYALARICHELFGDVEYAAIDTDRNKYPIGTCHHIFTVDHSFQHRYCIRLGSCHIRQYPQLLCGSNRQLPTD